MTTLQPSAQDDSGGGFRARTVLGLLIGVVVTASAFAILSVFAPELRQEQDAGATALSRSAVGYAGIVQLLRDTGKPVTVSRGAGNGKALDLLILTPPPMTKEADIDALAARAGVVLIVPQKWRSAPDLFHPGWADILGLLPADKVAVAERHEMTEANRAGATFAPVLTPRSDDHGFLSGQRFAFGPVERFQTSGQGEAEVALMDQLGRPVLLRALPPGDAARGAQGARAHAQALEGGDVYLLTDPDLLNNHGIANLKTAEAAVALLDRLSGPTASITFDVTLNGFTRDRGLLRTALTPPFLGATLCVIGAMLLTGWRALADFGPRERRGRALAFGKRALVDSSAGLIRMTGRTVRMGGRYAALVRSAALAAVGARETDAETADAYLDTLAKRAGAPPFSALAAQAGASKSDAELMRAATALSDWKSEIVGER